MFSKAEKHQAASVCMSRFPTIGGHPLYADVQVRSLAITSNRLAADHYAPESPAEVP